MNAVGPTEFGTAAMNSANDVLVACSEKKMSVAEAIAGATAQAHLAQAAATLALSEQVGRLVQAVTMHPGLSSDGLTNALRDVFAPRTDPFVAYRECMTGQGVAHLPHRWTLDSRNFYQCEGKTPAQLREQDL